jgi:hypothetical protein
MSAPQTMKEREAVKTVYPYKKWWRKVDAMTDAQIIALFFRFKREGKL